MENGEKVEPNQEDKKPNQNPHQAWFNRLLAIGDEIRQKFAKQRKKDSSNK